MKTILLAEDNQDDAYFIKNVIEDADIPHSLIHVTDGAAAIDYLAAARDFAGRMANPVPDLVFLDIKMPKRNGLEVLEWIRAQPAFEHLPVIMLTNSGDHRDTDRAHGLGVTSYLVKDADPSELAVGVRIILKYWLFANVMS
jgi:CheY-like chemotaxis protein